MDLSPNQRDKLDSKLWQSFQEARPEDVVTVILILRVEDADIYGQPHLADFSNYVEWRKALVEWRKNDLEQQIGSTVQAIKDLDLRVLSEGLMRLVVVTGSIENILKSLDLEKVQRVMYNYPVVPY